MKRLLPLMLALVLLCGCRQAPVAVDDSTPREPLSLTLADDMSVPDAFDWRLFLSECRTETLQIDENGQAQTVPMPEGVFPVSIEIVNTRSEDVLCSTLSFDGTSYTLTDADGSRSYRHLLYSTQQLPESGEYDFAEYYLLSDDPEMTADTYYAAIVSSTESGIAPTEIVYSDFFTFSRAECFGEVPADAREQIESTMQSATGTGKLGSYQGKSITAESAIFTPNPLDRLPDDALSPFALAPYGEGYILIRRHSFGNWKLSPVAVSYLPQYREVVFTCYDAEGTPLWQYTGEITVA